MSKDTSKLVKKQIVDKRGRRTSVWVSAVDVSTKKKRDKIWADAEATSKKVQEQISKHRLLHLSEALQKKVRRQGKGKGKQVVLTKPEVKELLEKGVVGFVSAGRNPNDPKDVKLSDKDIAKRTEDLKADLKDRGFQFVKVKGKYGEEEESFMVMIPDVGRDEMTEIGKKYNQDSVIYSEGKSNEMIFTTGENVGKKYSGKGFKELDKGTADFFTEVKTANDTIKFSLNFDFGQLKKGILGESFEALGVVKNFTNGDEPATEGDPVMVNLEELFDDDEEDEKKKKKDIEKAVDTSKLIPKVIIDKSGRKTTIWVKTGGGQKKKTKDEAKANK